ncbi:MAG: YihA family ribosome biogenesis GTP-binding protein, partial [Gemmatimonadota bacterium]|nr:YihA family ribosome biogenesis GTP-binding protein [Gemmatimonadota bacterium]
YMANRKALCAVLQLVDARRGPTDLDQQMIDHLRTLDKPFLLVFTKADKLSRNKLQYLFDQLDAQGSLAGLSFVPFSAVDGRGQDDITGWIAEALVGNAT